MKMPHNINKNKILFLISLPQVPEFLSYSDKVKNCIAKLERIGVDCFEEITPSLLSKANEYDLVIVIAHKSEEMDALILADGFLPINDFVNSLPPTFDGVLDFSSCHSVNAMERIKERCPNCLVQTSIGETTLPLRLFMYPIVIEALDEERDKAYDEVYSEVLEAIKERMANTPSSQQGKKLGENYSSIYAPSTIKRQKPFLIQVFFHKDNESGAADLLAQRIDQNTEKKDCQILPLKFKKKDNISVKVSFVSPAKEYIQLEDNIDTKHIIWLDQMTKVQFCAIVCEEFPYDSFVGKLMMEANCVPIGECYFNIKVADEERVAPAEVNIHEHDFFTEQKKARQACLTHFHTSISQINERLSICQDESEREELEHAKQVCTNCINIINNGSKHHHSPTKRVFVSSTSDMKPYREIVRQEIESCDMFPEMYENWPQSESTPRDECCRRVIDSDILLCILGARYGFVDPEINASMTEIEYRAALGAGKTILVYIIDPMNKTDEPSYLAERQKKLIEEIRDTRILKFFSDSESLAKDTVRNLSRLTY